MPDDLLTINTGSSSIKFSLHALTGPEGLQPVYRGAIDGIGTAPRFRAADAEGRALPPPDLPGGAGPGHEPLIEILLGWIEAHRGDGHIVAAGHRIVHGGAEFAGPVRLDERILAALASLTPLAPLHQPHGLEAIWALQRLRPELPQAASFDTAFHRGHAPEIEAFALPREFAESGVQRYGFHGLSYEFIAGALPRLAPEIARGRVVVAHLGNGASLCAMAAGRSIDSTMSLTPLDGLVMGTRCGALDPGVVLYLLQQRGMSAEAVADLLYHRSGLLGVSGISGDMRQLLSSPDPRAKDAIDMFVWRVARELGAAAVTLGGLDAVVFTAGIGENSPEIRERICARAAMLGIRLDAAANRRGGPRISLPDSPVSAWVVPTDEETMIARHTAEVLGLAPRS